MPATNINYIVYTTGHRRHHGGSQKNIIPPVSGKVSSGDSFPVTAFPSLKVDGNDLPFAFMCVTGGADGSQLYTTPGTQNIPVDGNDVNIIVVYAPVEGGGPGTPGVYVDAFNVDIGNFSDSDFMEVYTNGILDNAMTKTANDDGVVSSVSAEDLRSYNSVDGVPFLEWIKLDSASPVDNKVDYSLQVNEVGFVFAFYKTPKKQSPNLSNARTKPVWLAPGVAVEYDDLAVRMRDLANRMLGTIAILSIAPKMDEQVKNEAVELAVKNLNSIADSVRTINSGNMHK